MISLSEIFLTGERGRTGGRGGREEGEGGREGGRGREGKGGREGGSCSSYKLLAGLIINGSLYVIPWD